MKVASALKWLRGHGGPSGSKTVAGTRDAVSLERHKRLVINSNKNPHDVHYGYFPKDPFTLRAANTGLTNLMKFSNESIFWENI